MSSGHNVKLKAELEANLLNAQTLQKELEWFTHVLEARIAEYIPIKYTDSATEFTVQEEEKNTKSSWWNSTKQHQEKERPKAEPIDKILALPAANPSPIKTPDLKGNETHYGRFVAKHELYSDDRLIIMLALVPHLQPHVLDRLLGLDKTHGLGSSLFGGLSGTMHRGFLPTVETALFVLAGENLDYRLLVEELFSPEYDLLKKNIIQLVSPPMHEPFHASPLNLSDDALSQILHGRPWQPRFSTDFPAKLLTTNFSWEDLVLSEHIKIQLDHIDKWLSNPLRNEQYKELRLAVPGYRAIFFGPSGTGKTLAAALLGQRRKRAVYRIDLSMVVSKYIGETEKNLEKIFAMAESQENWILFFDEADALFGKRTNIADAHDKYANQDIAYLLQRLEDYPGLVILASNMQHNIDDAFIRRMQSVIHFNKPNEEERQKLWAKALQIGGIDLQETQIKSLSTQYELTGASIMNAIHYAVIEIQGHQAPASVSSPPNESIAPDEEKMNQQKLALQCLHRGIRYEFHKEGRSI